MQNDLCLKVGDTVLWRGNWVSVLATEDDKFWYDKKSSFAYASEITEVKYQFSDGDWVRPKSGAADVSFQIKQDVQAVFHTNRQDVVRVAYPTSAPVTMTNAKLGEVWAGILNPDIFHVEKRLRTGVRDVGGLTVTVSPNPEQTAVKIEFSRDNGKYINANQLREIASLLNEIADCL